MVTVFIKVLFSAVVSSPYMPPPTALACQFPAVAASAASGNDIKQSGGAGFAVGVDGYCFHKSFVPW